MAKNIVIEKDGVYGTYNASKVLRVKNPDGGYTRWIPLDETQLAEKNINENGTYNAAAQGYYGYNRVVVDVEGGVVGTRPDGNTYYVTTDENDVIVQKLLPSSLTVTTMPDKRNYTEGDDIDLTGMVAKAYDGNGTIWEDENYPDGVIPLSEITYTPLKATGDSVTIKWHRPHDNHQLEATFAIFVT